MSRTLFAQAILAVTLLAGCNRGGINTGDRVLVAKYLYEMNVTPPARFDVVVFKFPNKPIDKNIPKNYIKRLLGLPGELIAIFFGRLYRYGPDPAQGEIPFFKDETEPKVRAEDLWQPKFMHDSDERCLDLFREGKFEPIRKPPGAMMALRRIVNDNDFQPADLKAVLPSRWISQGNADWTLSGTTFSHEGQGDKNQENWLRYQHILRPLGGGALVAGQKFQPELITDQLGYNSSLPDRLGSDSMETKNKVSRGRHWVGDLMMECQAEVKGNEGAIWLELSKGIYRYQARFNVANGECTLWRKNLNGAVEKLGVAVTTALKGPGVHDLRFANIDARLTVWVNNSMPFGDGFEYSPPEVRAPGEKITEEDLMQRRGPHEKNDLEPASIATVGARVKLQHLKLWRDTYYITNLQADLEVKPDNWAAPETFQSLRGLRPKTLYVQPNHYLCLGDNSQESSDSREWGTVPHRLMLGRAILVYFPLNRAGLIR